MIQKLFCRPKMSFYISVRSIKHYLEKEVIKNSSTIQNLINDAKVDDDYEFNWVFFKEENAEEILDLLTEDFYCDNFSIIVEAFRLANYLGYKPEKFEKRVFDFFIKSREQHFKDQFIVLKEQKYPMFYLCRLFNKILLDQPTVDIILESFYPGVPISEAVKNFDQDVFSFRQRSEFRTIYLKENNSPVKKQIKVLVTERYGEWKEWIVNSNSLSDVLYLNPCGQLRNLSTKSNILNDIYQKIFYCGNYLILEDSENNIIKLNNRFLSNPLKLNQKLDGKLEHAFYFSYKIFIITKEEGVNMLWLLDDLNCIRLSMDNFLETKDIISVTISTNKIIVKTKEKRTKSLYFCDLVENKLCRNQVIEPTLTSFDLLGPERYLIKELKAKLVLTGMGNLYVNVLDNNYKKIFDSALITSIILTGDADIFVGI